MTYSLQSRWKLKDNQLVYYGLQNKENLFKNKIKISRRQAEIISSLPKELSENELNLLGKLLNKQVSQWTKYEKYLSQLTRHGFAETAVQTTL